MFLLVEFNGEYGDEFSVEGFSILSEKKFNSMMEVVKLWFDIQTEIHGASHVSLEQSFGTNQFLEWFSFNEFRNAFSVTKLSREEVRTLKKFFPRGSGVFPSPSEKDLFSFLQERNFVYGHKSSSRGKNCIIIADNVTLTDDNVVIIDQSKLTPLCFKMLKRWVSNDNLPREVLLRSSESLSKYRNADQ